MKYFYHCCIVLSLLGCSKKDDPSVASNPDADQWSGTTWVRYGFKSPVNGKDTYYYLTFKPNYMVDNYVRVNKTESPTNLTTGTYVNTGLKFTFTINNAVSTGELTSNGLVVTNTAGSVTYIKE